MYSMPNGAQALVQVQEGVASTEESGEWESSDEEQEEESEESVNEEEVDSPLRSER